MKKSLIWGHRGASGYAPENTLEAFDLAAKQGADGVELDVQLTCDGEVVVVHDERIERVSNGMGFVKDYTLKELKGMKFNQTHPEYVNAKIATLAEVYDLLLNTPLTVNVELKTSVIFYPGIEEKILKLASDAGMEERIWYSSFNHYSLLRLKELDSQVKTGILFSEGFVDVPAYAERLGVDAVHPGMWNLQYPNFCEECKNRNLPIHVWTVNKREEISQMCDKGVEAIITNYPDRACRIRG